MDRGHMAPARRRATVSGEPWRRQGAKRQELESAPGVLASKSETSPTSVAAQVEHPDSPSSHPLIGVSPPLLLGWVWPRLEHKHGANTQMLSPFRTNRNPGPTHQLHEASREDAHWEQHHQQHQRPHQHGAPVTLAPAGPQRRPVDLLGSGRGLHLRGTREQYVRRRKVEGTCKACVFGPWVLRGLAPNNGNAHGAKRLAIEACTTCLAPVLAR